MIPELTAAPPSPELTGPIAADPATLCCSVALIQPQARDALAAGALLLVYVSAYNLRRELGEPRKQLTPQSRS